MNNDRIQMNRPLIMMEIVSYIFIFAALAVAIAEFRTGKVIPTHFDLMGNIDGYGTTEVLIMLPIMMLPTNGLCSLMIHFLPTSFMNMPFKVKPERSVPVFQCIGYMIMVMELIFSIYTFAFTLLLGAGHGSMCGPISILMIVLLVVDIIAFTILAGKKNK